ncbi:MAG: ATP-binding protein [Dehalococcoidia bacterium]|nr:ATP-binding protein [Dehalococcoidia bacterium]
MPNKINRCTISTNSTPRKSGLIGRRLELAGLTATLDGALAGRGQMVMLAGEPGIGKTTLAQ